VDDFQLVEELDGVKLKIGSSGKFRVKDCISAEGRG
jgi:hypothetical protein